MPSKKDGTSSTGADILFRFYGAEVWRCICRLGSNGTVGILRLQYRRECVQTPEALDGLKYLMSFIPAAIAALSIVVVFIYPLNKTRMAAINADLKERRENL